MNRQKRVTLRNGAIALLLAVISFEGVCESDHGDCYALFRERGAIPKTKECHAIAAPANRGLGGYSCHHHIKSYCSCGEIPTLGRYKEPEEKEASFWLSKDDIVGLKNIMVNGVGTNWIDFAVSKLTGAGSLGPIVQNVMFDEYKVTDLITKSDDPKVAFELYRTFVLALIPRTDDPKLASTQIHRAVDAFQEFTIALNKPGGLQEFASRPMITRMKERYSKPFIHEECLPKSRLSEWVEPSNPSSSHRNSLRDPQLKPFKE